VRIIYVTSSMPYGPAETFLISEVEEVRKQGHEVLVVPMYPRGSVLHTDAKPLLEYVCAQPLLSPPIAKGAAEAFVQDPLRTFRALSWLFRGRSAKVLLKNLAVYPKGLWLARLAREWKADHIHAHWAATTASMALVASEVSRVPWSFTAHSGDITDWSFSAALPGAAKNALLSLKAFRACFVRFISRSGLRKAGLTETGSSPKVFVLHMGVELADLSAVRHEDRRGRATVVCCPADIIPVKGHKYLIKAVAILQERGLDLELWLAGEGVLEEELREQREALNLSNRIIFLGMLPHQRLMDLYRRGEVDIVALPSVDLGGGEHEGVPVSLIEAMSYRVPVVSTTTGGIPELLGGGAGVMVPPADPTTLAEAIGRLIQDPELREQQGDAGRERVEESFSLEKVADELIARFETCAQ
jgi:colanic acid/amylovoran biosynthesis glycosyltransferase